MSTPSRPRPNHDWLALTAFILASFAASAIGASTGTGSSPWYQSLDRPPWTPPGWLFGPVWTALYFAMGIAAWLVWRRAGFRAARTALILFAIQLILNAAWTPTFFGAQRLDLALVVIIALDIAVVATTLAFRRHDQRAAWLMIPYLAWLLFATALNAAFMVLNPP
jgi:benzodiazapine receptor